MLVTTSIKSLTKTVLIGTFPKNYEDVLSKGNSFKEGLVPKNSFGGGGNGISHAPNTLEGAGMAFVGGDWRVAFRYGFSVTGGTDLMLDKGNGYANKTTQFFGLGADSDHAEMTHVNKIQISRGRIGDASTGAKKEPSIWIGCGKNGQLGNKCWLSDGKGGLEGLEGRVYMRNSWAVPDNQFCIYARFG